MSFFGVYPVPVGSVPTYANLAAFPSASAAGNGALAIALDTNKLYESNGTSWLLLADPASTGTAITSLTGDVTATGPGAAAASLVATTNATLTTISTLVSVGTITTGAWNATPIAIAYGGTGQTSAAAAFSGLSPITTTGDMIYSSAGTTNSRLAIGSTGNVLTVSGGVPVWAAPATSGTVTSVAMTVPSFLSVSGSPITSSGTLAVTLSGTALPIANGGTGQTTASAAFSALSPITTTGDMIYSSSGTTNSRRAIGSTGNVLTVSGGVPVWAAPATSGTVTSVAMTVPSFLSVSGSPITSSGTLAVTLSGTALPVANGGTGVTSSTGSTNVVLSGSPTIVTPAIDQINQSTSTNGVAIQGRTSGTAISAGNVGAILTATSSSSVNTTTETSIILDNCSISVTAGSWLIGGTFTIRFFPNGCNVNSNYTITVYLRNTTDSTNLIAGTYNVNVTTASYVPFGFVATLAFPVDLSATKAYSLAASYNYGGGGADAGTKTLYISGDITPSGIYAIRKA